MLHFSYRRSFYDNRLLNITEIALPPTLLARSTPASVLEFGRRAYNQVVAPGITRPSHPSVINAAPHFICKIVKSQEARSASTDAGLMVLRV